MAFRLASTTASSSSTSNPTPSAAAPSSSGSSCASTASDDEDDNFEDWQDDGPSGPVFSLFGGKEKEFKSVKEASAWDKEKAGLDFDKEVERLGLDFHSKVRLINHIRKENPTPESIQALEPSNPLFKDDALLIPVIENDPFLLFDDSWSSDEDGDEPSSSAPAAQNASSSNPASSDLISAQRRILALEQKLSNLQSSAASEIASLRTALLHRSGVSSSDSGAAAAPAEAANGKGKGKEVNGDKGKKVVINGPGLKKAEGEEGRDDDSHYFDSYAYNDIHEVMLKDTIRTKTYALFILSNPALFKGATVLDVGCGTGILSLLAAKAGAAHVYAVDASSVAIKAIENIKANGYADKITVLRGKVEDIELPEGVKADVIISEWMGYFLLYESMLDSVLVARDRFMKPTGIMAPSQTKIVLSGIDCAAYMHERVGFWNDVYGFNMEAMAEKISDDSFVEILDASTVATTYATIKDIHTQTATIRSLDFTSAFSISSTRSEPSAMHAFLGHFDTFFTPDGSAVSDDVPVSLEKFDESLKIEGRPGEKNTISFTTGPEGIPTHWKQTVFLLKEPIQLVKGSTINGKFHCHKSTTNSRELDVEIHYTVSHPSDSEEKPASTMVQLFKVR